MTLTDEIKHILKNAPEPLTAGEILTLMNDEDVSRATIEVQLARMRSNGAVVDKEHKIIGGLKHLTWTLTNPIKPDIGTTLKEALLKQQIILDPTDPVESLIGQSILKYRESKKQFPPLEGIDETISALSYLTPILADTYKQRIEKLISIINPNGAKTS